MKLSDMKKGDIAKIKNIQSDANLKKRLLDIGVVNNSSVKIEKIASFGDIIEVKIKNYNLSLRKSECDNIIVEMIYISAR